MINRVARGLGSEKSLFILTLGLTPALGVTTTLAGAVVYGIFFLFALAITTTITAALQDATSPRISFAVGALVLAGLTTGADILMTMYLPEVRKSLGIYLPLTAVNPLILLWGFDKSQQATGSATLGAAFKAGFVFLFILILTALVRESLGAGQLSLPAIKTIIIPGLSVAPLHILLMTSGGFILLGLLKALLNIWEIRRGREITFDQLVPAPDSNLEQENLARQPLISKEFQYHKQAAPTAEPVSAPVELKTERPPQEIEEKTSAESPLDSPAEPENPEQNQAAPLGEAPVESPDLRAENPTTEEAPPAPSNAETLTSQASEQQAAAGEEFDAQSDWQDLPTAPSKAKDWGETLESILVELGKNRDVEKKRVLVLGCGTGEDAYHCAMILMESQKTNPRLNFRVRGVDNFPARIETALAGVYREPQVEFIPLELKRNYMLKSRDEEKKLVRISNEVRGNLEFDTSDYLSEDLYFSKPADVILLNQNVDYLNPDKKRQLLRQIKSHLGKEGALYLRFPLARELIPEGFKRTGEKVFRRR